MGLPVTDFPDKPQALIFYEQMEEFHTLPYSGGFMEQPYILMRELKIVSEVVTIFRNLARARQLAEEQQETMQETMGE